MKPTTFPNQLTKNDNYSNNNALHMPCNSLINSYGISVAINTSTTATTILSINFTTTSTSSPTLIFTIADTNKNLYNNSSNNF